MWALKSKGFVYHRGFGGKQKYVYTRNLDGQNYFFIFPDLRQNELVITVEGPYVEKDELSLFFLPDSANPIIYAMKRSVVTDGRSVGSQKIWDGILAKYGPTEQSKKSALGDKKSLSTTASYNWDSRGAKLNDVKCRWKPYGPEGYQTLSVTPYEIEDYEGFSGSLNKGCATVVTFVENSDASLGVTRSIESVAFDNELYLTSIQRNLDVLNEEIGRVTGAIEDYKSSLGQNAPEL